MNGISFQTIQNRNTFIALTALWAFVESGLGGIMHAFHIPFTGIFLGGFSVLVISLIAHFEQKPFQQIIQATLIVMAVKASVNPATSPMAYIAVGFQGICGAAIYSIPYRNVLLSVSFAVLAMLESAFQKLLILTVLFGTKWIEALDTYYNSVAKIMGMPGDSPFSLYVVLLYVSIYLVWGILLGIWAERLPQQIHKRKTWYDDLKAEEIAVATVNKRGKKRMYFFFIITTLMVLYTFIRPEDSKGGGTLAIVSRTLLVILIWIYIILPLWRQFVLKKLAQGGKKDMPEILTVIPQISSKTKPLYRHIQKEYSGLRKWKEFVLGLMVISLQDDEDS